MIETIDYIEVSIFDGGVETTGLLTHYDVKSKRIHLLTDGRNTNELFDLKFYTVTRIQIGKSGSEYETLEQYIFKSDDDDQDTSKNIILNQLKVLEIEGRTTVSGFLTKDTFTNLPEKYVKATTGVTPQTIIQNQRASSLGGKAVTPSTTTGNTTVYNGYNNDYQKRNTKTVSFLPRTSKLPSKAFLKRMKAKVAAIAANTFKPEFPIDEDDDIKPGEITQADVDEALYGIYGQMGEDGIAGGYHPYDI